MNAPRTVPGGDEPRYERALSRFSVPLLRIALGVVFVWFGALKVAQETPVADLVARTVPFLDAGWFVPALGAFEVLLGLLLMSGRLIFWTCAAMIAHLNGTFLVYFTQPDVAFRHGNPLLITTEGEFVAKNIVLITAGLVVASWSGRQHLAHNRGRAATAREETTSATSRPASPIHDPGRPAREQDRSGHHD